MATVYKAYDTRLETDVAVKVIRTDVLPQNAVERTLKRFEREAKSLARLTHPNIVKVMDYGEYNGAPYLVLVYLPGGTLKKRMGQPMPWQEAVRILIPIANALEYAHEHKVVHRDVKPANILLTEKGQPMLTDFGIAKILEMEDGHTLTGTGMGIGTPEYMSPEQGMGRDVDGRADIYSMGIIFYELVTGSKPYTADTPMAVVLKHMTDPLPRPSHHVTNLPETVEKVLLKALAKDPKARYPDAGAFAVALENLINKNQPYMLDGEKTSSTTQDTSETVDTFATNLQAKTDTNTRQKTPIQQIPVTKSDPAKPSPALSKGMLMGLGMLSLIVISLWIGSLLKSSTADPTAIGVPASAIAPTIAGEVPDISTKAPLANGLLVGISMPTMASTRWISDGESMVKAFEDLGYATELQFANNDIPNQLAQIENMITNGADVLVIAAIDGTTLSDVLQQAKDAGVLVIAYDRLISKTANVDYYTTFDNFGVGVIMGTQIEAGLDLKNAVGPFNIELFGGSPDDTNAFYFYDGAMSVLQSYIDNGKLVVQSRQVGMDKVGTLRWDSAVAQARMDNLLSASYTDKRVDAILSPYDGLSRGIISSLRGVGYGTADLPWPIITGQDAEVASVKAMIAGEQTYTVFKDTRELAKQTAAMVDAVLKGQEVPINDTKTYDNGVKIVPSYLLIPYSVDISNYEELLIGSGYITADQLK